MSLITLIGIMVCVVVLSLVIADIVITAKATDDFDPVMLFFIHLPVFFMGIAAACDKSAATSITLLVFIGILSAIMIIHAIHYLKKLLHRKYVNDKYDNTEIVYENKEVEVCTEPKTVDDKVSCFKAYKINTYKKYKKEKWDEYHINCIFSSKDLLNELLKHKTKIASHNAYLGYKVAENDLKTIKAYFKFDENYDGDIDLNNLKFAVWEIDGRAVYIIGGPNKKLELYGDNNTQFLCYGYKYGEGKDFIMLDYSIDNLMHRINNYFGICNNNSNTK